MFAGDPRQDDFDIWIDIDNFQPWVATQRHSSVANYLYIDGHVAAYSWAKDDNASLVAIGLYPDSMGAPCGAHPHPDARVFTRLKLPLIPGPGIRLSRYL